MDLMNIYVIFDRNRYTKEEVVEIIKEEGYKHNFVFANKFKKDEIEKYLDIANEVWLFGECRGIFDYHVAVEKGADIWCMG